MYSEQIRGYPSLRYLQLNCNLFGQAGYYTLYLTSGMHGTGSIIAKLPTEAVLKVSENIKICRLFFINYLLINLYFCSWTRIDKKKRISEKDTESTISTWILRDERHMKRSNLEKWKKNSFYSILFNNRKYNYLFIKYISFFLKDNIDI